MKKLFFLFIFSGTIFISCQTKISYKVKYLPVHELENVKSIAVLPFQEPARTPFLESFITMLITKENPNKEYEETGNIAGRIKKNIENVIKWEEYFDLIPDSDILENIKKNDSSTCDAYITGHIEDFACNIENKNDTYNKTVTFNIIYEVFSSSGILLLHYKDSINASSREYEKKTNLPSASVVSENSIFNSALRFIHKIQPYYKTVRHNLLNENSKNKDFKLALKFAKKRELNTAKELFRQIYERDNIWEAAYNAAIIHQAYGEYEEAIKLMKIAVKRSRHPRVYSALMRIENDMENEMMYLQEICE